MHKRNSAYSVIFFFLIVSVVLFLFSRLSFFRGISSFFQTVFSPLTTVSSSFSKTVYSTTTQKDIASLQKENRELIARLSEFNRLKKENAALSDQFQQQGLSSTVLLPATVVGRPSFIPNITEPEYLVINKGISDGVTVGKFVVSENSLVGQIDSATNHFSRITLITNSSSSFTAGAQDKKGEALGVVKGQDDSLLLTNVLLSDTLQKGDIVVTKGDTDTKGSGMPPNIVLGKIESIDKNPSALFQTAQIALLLDFSKLDTVFVVLQKP